MRRRHLIIVVIERWSQRDTLLQNVDRLLVFVRALVSLGKMKIWIGIIRLLLHCLLEQCDRFVPFAINDEENAEIKISEVLVGVRGILYIMDRKWDEAITL